LVTPCLACSIRTSNSLYMCLLSLSCWRSSVHAVHIIYLPDFLFYVVLSSPFFAYNSFSHNSLSHLFVYFASLSFKNPWELVFPRQLADSCSVKHLAENKNCPGVLLS
jgi:hypothetical protein